MVYLVCPITYRVPLASFGPRRGVDINCCSLKGVLAINFFFAKKVWLCAVCLGMSVMFMEKLLNFFSNV